MTEFLGLPLPLLLLLPLALAAGVDLFLTILVVVASVELGWGILQDTSHTSLRWGILMVVTLLYLLEVVMEIRPMRGLIWHNLQLILRPLGGALLALTVLEGIPTPLFLLGTLLAAVVTAFTHVLSWGGKLHRLLSPDRRVSPLTHSLAEDTLVLAFLVFTVEHPGPVFLLSSALLLAGLLAGTQFHHLTRFGIALLRDRVWGIVSPTRWQDAPELPGWIGRWSRAEGFLGIQGLRAGARGLPGTRGFREGWVLESGARRFFAFRSLRAPVFIPLDGFQMSPAEPSSIAVSVPMAGADGSKSALFLQRGGPGLKSHK